MAAPVYLTDLITITNCEVTTGFSQIGAAGNISIGAGVDFAIQGINAVDAKLNNKTSGMAFIGPAITNVVGLHFFAWIFIGTPGIANTRALGGKQMCIGTSTVDYMSYYVDGKDTQPEGGHKCYAVRYTTTPSALVVKTGNPAANPTLTGAIMSSIGTSKGSNFGIDVMRYGTGAFISGGELIIAGDATDNPATFAGFAAINDLPANKYGIMSSFPGGYTLQGTCAIGQDNTGTPVLCRLLEKDKVINIIDTPFSATDFTKILIDHANTYVSLTNVTFISPGSNNLGQFIVNNPASDVTLSFVIFDGFGTSVLQSNTMVESTSWRTSGQITQNGAILDNCVINNSTSTSAIISDSLNNITNTDFNSSGVGHAIEVPSFITNVTLTSNNNTFNGYAATNGSTGNESIYFRATSGNITLNVPVGGAPSIRTDGVIVTIVLGTVTTTITVVDFDTLLPIPGARVYLKAAAGGDYAVGTEIINTTTDLNGQVIDTRTMISNQPVDGRVRKSSSAPFYKTSPIVGVISSSSGMAVTIQLIPD